MRYSGKAGSQDEAAGQAGRPPRLAAAAVPPIPLPVPASNKLLSAKGQF